MEALKPLRLVLAVIWVILLLALTFGLLQDGGSEALLIVYFVALPLLISFSAIGLPRNVNIPLAPGSPVLEGIIGGFVLGVFWFGFSIGFGEFINFKDGDSGLVFAFVCGIAGWIVGAVLLNNAHRTQPTAYQAFGRMLKTMFILLSVGTLLLLLMHVETSSRGQKFAGLGTALGIAGGVITLYWTVGAWIYYLFQRDRFAPEIKTVPLEDPFSTQLPGPESDPTRPS